MSPMYEFKCETCGRYSDELHKLAERPDVINCHHCGGRAGRALSAGNFIVPGGEIRVRNSPSVRSDRKDD